MSGSVTRFRGLPEGRADGLATGPRGGHRYAPPRSASTLVRGPKHFVPGLIAAVAGWFVHALTLYFVFLSLDIYIGLAIPFVVVPTAGLSEGLSMLPGGIGVFEPAFVALLIFLTPIGVSAATNIVILYRLSNYWFGVGLGFASVSVLVLTDMFQGSVKKAVSPARDEP